MKYPMTDEQLDEMLSKRIIAKQLVDKNYDEETTLAIAYIISIVEKALRKNEE